MWFLYTTLEPLEPLELLESFELYESFESFEPRDFLDFLDSSEIPEPIEFPDCFESLELFKLSLNCSSVDWILFPEL